MTQTRMIIAEVCRKWGLSLDDLRSSKKTPEFCIPRSELCYRLRHESKLTYWNIARRVNRDHSTVMSAVKKWPEYRTKFGPPVVTPANKKDGVQIAMEEWEAQQSREAENKAERIRKHQEHCQHIGQKHAINGGPKRRKCLTCGDMFSSRDYCHRVCNGCKHTSAWREGNDLTVFGCGRPAA